MDQSVLSHVTYICLAAAPDSDLCTLFPVESHVERHERGSSAAHDLFLVSSQPAGKNNAF